MEDSNNYGHRHPLVLLNEDQLISSPSGVVAVCSSCREKVSAPCFRCAEDCGSYLHKHVALEDPLISTKKDDEQLDDVPMCFGCWEPLANYTLIAIGSLARYVKKPDEEDLFIVVQLIMEAILVQNAM
ncbi:hypothetical protein F3Y22_tig00110478pilonHSYRG00133 [Hibiscus syriacus]|uniref:Uncharacterized protein n=1 Tax=Hibiscus syriacus TaxID=106335 RepID=A0A6A3AJA2_HIBSY|nr:hypothetical protein F3Y22_tig00110478pilonHSYRG00133 [Hibiscus syriacus]